MCKKECTRCHRVRNLREFHKNVRAKDGYTCWCADCVEDRRLERESQAREEEVSTLLTALYL